MREGVGVRQRRGCLSWGSGEGKSVSDGRGEVKKRRGQVTLGNGEDRRVKDRDGGRVREREEGGRH